MTRTKAPISELDFGSTSRGEAVSIYTLTNTNGMKVVITNYGGTIISLTVPDRKGVFENIVLGYKTLADYESGKAYLGALIGRYGNRIAGGRFELNGEGYILARNNEPNHLHGGNRGFDRVIWRAERSMSINGPGLLLEYTSNDGEEGYPGTLVSKVRYTLSNDNELRIDYEAVTDKATPVNLTSHCYFNLSGEAKRDILGHWLEIAADYFTAVDSNLVPTGEFCPVDDSPFDFRSARPVGDGINADHEQLIFGGGYDHNWVIDRQAAGQARYMATVSDPDNGRVMKVYSTEPGVQFYTGNFLNGTAGGKGMDFQDRYGLCLETQHFPDSPNQPNFPSTILQPGQIYSTQTIYSCSTA
mgnify:CR=1 FL=1